MNPRDPYTGQQINAVRQMPHYHAIEITTSGEYMKHRIDWLYAMAILAVALRGRRILT